MPVRTARDAYCNCIALMDAAGCFILGPQFICATTVEPARAEFRLLLKNARRHKQQLSDTLFIACEDVAELMTREATHRHIDVVRASRASFLFHRRSAPEFRGKV